jgi:ABC-type amino acid transport system permease subunit
MDVELLEEDTLGHRAVFLEVWLLQIIEVELRFLIVSLGLLVDVFTSLLQLYPLSVLQDVQDVLIEFIAEVPIQVQVEWSEFEEENFEVVEILDGLIVDVLDLEMDKVGAPSSLTLHPLQNDGVILSD